MSLPTTSARVRQLKSVFLKLMPERRILIVSRDKLFDVVQDSAPYAWTLPHPRYDGVSVLSRNAAQNLGVIGRAQKILDAPVKDASTAM